MENKRPFAIGGGIIGATILIDKDDRYIYNQRSERIICNNDIYPLYMWYFLNSSIFRRQVISLAQGGTQIYVNFSSVKELMVQVPCMEEQKKISNFLQCIDKKLELESEILLSLITLKKGLLQKMFI